MFPAQSDAAIGQRAPLAFTMLGATLMAAVIGVLAIATPRIMGLSESSSVPSSFVAHSVMLGLAVALSIWLTGGQIARFGFTKGSFRLTPRYFLWVLPMSIVSALQIIGSRSSAISDPLGPHSPIEIVLLVWIYASICEEVFVRGLYQSCLSAVAQYRVSVFRHWSLSVPVLLSGLFFGGMHIVVWPRMGPKTLVIMAVATILGIIAGHYRKRTGSLVPAILIHALFNIGGTLPLWVINAAFSRC